MSAQADWSPDAAARGAIAEVLRTFGIGASAVAVAHDGEAVALPGDYEAAPASLVTNGTTTGHFSATLLSPGAEGAAELALLAGSLEEGGLVVWPLSGGTFGRDEAARHLFATGLRELRFHTVGSRLFATARKVEVRTSSPEVLSVVLPVFNERETFRQVIEALDGVTIPGIELEVIVVESNSTDGTREDVLKLEGKPGFRLILEEGPKGKGHAVRNGLAHATGDFVLIQDADLEYDLDDYAKLLEPLRRAEANFVLGVRTRTSGAKYGVRHFERQVFMSRMMNLGNSFFLALFNLVYGVRLEDPFTMYKVLRRDCLVGVTLECNRFDLDWELTGKLVRLGYRPLEIPVSYTSRSFSDGKKISILRDPLTWVVACFKYRFSPIRNWAH